MSSKKSVNEKFTVWFIMGCMFLTLGSLFTVLLTTENSLLSSIFGIEITILLPVIFGVTGLGCIVKSIFIKAQNRSSL